jgi:hypothetical protein
MKWMFLTRRALAPMLAVILMLGALVILPSDARAIGDDDGLVRVTRYYTSGSYTQMGATGDFTFDIEYSSLWGVGSWSMLEISIGGAFAFADGSQWKWIYGSQITARLLYKGEGDSLAITLRYYDSTTGGYITQAPQTIYIAETMRFPTPTPAPTPEPTPNPELDEPRMVISGSVPTLNAGQMELISLQLRNETRFDAYNVSVLLTDGATKIFHPTTLTGNEVNVGPVYSGDTRAARLYVNVRPDAEEGDHEIGVRITMTNQGGRSIVQTDAAIKVRVVNPNKKTPPALIITSSSLDKNMPGEDGIIRLTVGVRNVGEETASDVRFMLSGLKDGLTLNEGLPLKNIAGTLAENAEATVVYELKVPPHLPTKVYDLDANIRFKLPDGTEGQPINEKLYLNIIQPPEKTPDEQIQMTSMRQSATDPGSSNTVTLSISFRNFGTAPANDAVFSFEGLSSSTFTLMGTFGDRQIGTIAPGQTVPLSLSLYAASELPNGNHQLKTILTYTDSLNETKKLETMIYVLIMRPPTPSPTPEPTPAPPDASVPRVIISQHSISEQTVTAGNPFDLLFTLANTSRNKDVKNMKVTITDIDGIFLPVAGVNSFYVEELRIGASVDLSISLTPKQDAETKSYPVTISLSYEDKDNAPYTVNESLSIPVYQPQRIEVSNVSFFGDGMGGANLTFQYINKGKSPLYNLTIKLEGPMALMEGDYFAGNFPAGSMDYFEDSILPQSFGEVSGFVVLHFEDAAGNPMEHREEISAWIDEGGRGEWIDPGFPPIDPEWPGGEFPGPEGEGGGEILGLAPWLFWTLLGVIVTAAGIVVVIVIVRKKRRAAAIMDDDDE